MVFFTGYLQNKVIIAVPGEPNTIPVGTVLCSQYDTSASIAFKKNDTAALSGLAIRGDKSLMHECVNRRNYQMMRHLIDINYPLNYISKTNIHFEGRHIETFAIVQAVRNDDVVAYKILFEALVRRNEYTPLLYHYYQMLANRNTFFALPDLQMLVKYNDDSRLSLVNCNGTSVVSLKNDPILFLGLKIDRDDWKIDKGKFYFATPYCLPAVYGEGTREFSSRGSTHFLVMMIFLSLMSTVSAIPDCNMSNEKSEIGCKTDDQLHLGRRDGS